MNIARFRGEGRVRHGVDEGDSVTDILGSPFQGEVRMSSRTRRLSGVRRGGGQQPRPSGPGPGIQRPPFQQRGNPAISQKQTVSDREWLSNRADPGGRCGALRGGTGRGDRPPGQPGARSGLRSRVYLRQRCYQEIMPSIVRYISQYTTLFPDGPIFTGTSGSTRALKPGDVVEVEISGIGTLKNPVLMKPISYGGGVTRVRRRH